MRKQRVNIGQIRRDEIIAATIAIIDEKGIDQLSLSAIEKRAGMSRGQLTYYFPTREKILLAVFDRLLQLMKERVEAGGTDHPCGQPGAGWERLRAFLTFFVLHPIEAREFHSLQYTFLSQIGHREDFRQRLADLYGEWRAHIADDLGDELARRGKPAVSATTFASLVQAILHGLAMQRVADPESFDRQEMLDLCLNLLGNYFRPAASNGLANPRKKAAARPRRSAGRKTTGDT